MPENMDIRHTDGIEDGERDGAKAIMARRPGSETWERVGIAYGAAAKAKRVERIMQTGVTLVVWEVGS